MAYSRETLLAELERDEGLRLRVYDDATGLALKKGDTLKGLPSVGIGRNLVDVGISADEARAMLKADVDRAERDLDRSIPWWRALSDNRQRVLLNMVFNLGLTRLLGFKKMLGAVQTGEYDRAASEMTSSRWAEQVGERARRLATLMMHG